MRAKALLAAAAGILLCLPAIAQTAAAAPAAAPAAAHAAPMMSADDIIAKNIAARGGLDKINATKAVRTTGKMMMGPGMEAPFVMEWKAPNRIRIEFVVQGQTGVQAYDGTTGWMVMPFMGKTEPEKMAEEQRADMEQEADFAGPLVDYAKKGHHVRLVGKMDADGTDAYDLEVTLKNGDVVHEIIDADTFLTIKELAKRKQGDQQIEVEQNIGDYKPVGGLMLPFSLQSHMKGAPAGAPGQTITIDKYDFGASIDDSRFAFPPKAPAAPAKPGR